MLNEEFLFVIGEVVESKNALTVETGTLHYAVGFQFVCGDDGAARIAGVCDYAHG